MKNFLFVLAIIFHCGDQNNTVLAGNTPVETKPPASVKDCKKCIILSEQSQSRVAIADVASKKIIWEWKPADTGMKTEHVNWFSNMSDAKVVYDGKDILATASGGGVALVRISDKKIMFYAYAGGNPHSAEVFPDGNIVSASSTGDHLTLFKVDTVNFPDNVYQKKIFIEFGHNVVWDRKNQLLWSAAREEMKVFKYNFNCNAPDLTEIESIAIPGMEAHDLFPVFGEAKFWLTMKSNVYTFDVASKTAKLADGLQSNIKSVSSGPKDFPVIVIQPKEQWWTDEVKDIKGNSVFYQQGLKIYKARWLVDNSFSYPENDLLELCK
jgi:hypothetical protein